MRALLVALAFSALSCRGVGPDSPSGPFSESAVEARSFSSTIFVSPAGSDAGDGRSEGSALQTIGRAVATARAGELVRILPGVYVEEVVLEGRDFGSSPLVVEGDPGAVLDGERRLAVGFAAVETRGLDVRGLEIRSYTDIGLNVSFSESIALRSLRVHGNGFRSQDPGTEGEGFGINVESSSDVRIEENEVYNNGPEPSIRARGVFGTGINTYGNRNALIRRNEAHHNVGGGILVEDSIDVVVEENQVYANDLDNSDFQYWDGGLWLDGGRDVIVRNNTFRDNLGPGILVSDEEAQGPTGYVLESNTSRGNYFGIYIWGFGACPFPEERVLRLAANDFSSNSRLDLWCEES